VKTIKIRGTGLIYRNPKPHVRSVHAYFPSVIIMKNGEMLASFVLGEAFEAVNLSVYIARSKDNGMSWQFEGRLRKVDTSLPVSETARITALPEGEIVALIEQFDRTGRTDEGLTNPETLGFVPTKFLLCRSRDYGRTWGKSEYVKPPITGPEFEMCSPIVVLKDGRWILPTSTWRRWDGFCPDGMKAVALFSSDNGRSWNEWSAVMDSSADKIMYWESKILEMQDGRLMAVAWAYDQSRNVDLPNQFAVSTDGGKNWSAPESTELFGQTLTPLLMPDGSILSVYRRIDRPGLWAVLSRLDGRRWTNSEQTPLWGADSGSLTSHTENMAANFNVLKFGAPCLLLQPDGAVFVAFWCYEECVSVIRWFKLEVPTA